MARRGAPRAWPRATRGPSGHRGRGRHMLRRTGRRASAGRSSGRAVPSAESRERRSIGGPSSRAWSRRAATAHHSRLISTAAAAHVQRTLPTWMSCPTCHSTTPPGVDVHRLPHPASPIRGDPVRGDSSGGLRESPSDGGPSVTTDRTCDDVCAPSSPAAVRPA